MLIYSVDVAFSSNGWERALMSLHYRFAKRMLFVKRPTNVLVLPESGRLWHILASLNGLISEDLGRYYLSLL
jgi:hypothetical protein